MHPSTPSQPHNPPTPPNPPTPHTPHTSTPPNTPVPSVLDRRNGIDRRGSNPSDSFTDPATGLERRRGPGRRRTDFTRAAEEGELTPEQFLFVMAIDAFKKANDRAFPTWTDVLEVIRLLGYRKTQPSQLNIRAAEDWKEPPDAPANVKQKPGHREAA